MKVNTELHQPSILDGFQHAYTEPPFNIAADRSLSRTCLHSTSYSVLNHEVKWLWTMIKRNWGPVMYRKVRTSM
ncbi:unnamed protein product [Calypogeia fissa]